MDKGFARDERVKFTKKAFVLDDRVQCSFLIVIVIVLIWNKETLGTLLVIFE